MLIVSTVLGTLLTICAFCLKARLHTWHTKGFSPVWILRCCLKLNRFELIRSPHTGQHLSSDLGNDNVHYYFIQCYDMMFIVSHNLCGEHCGQNLPVIVHVDIEIVETGEHGVALDAVNRPKVVLNLVFILADRGVVGGGI